ncbi:hypothetical protein [Azohydromonas lata]|uniref:Quinol:cytochrome c oxidoreductase quinone-binding subunit 2 n=1 Tax=Azohydromonas lata TaxID=45677 RepID=A0ABU5IE00_9BURK|nr:hypothetical protein [Azohydromonas lata]MDZ5457348.1 hypothetical protein [Azohydromonas lata]
MSAITGRLLTRRRVAGGLAIALALPGAALDARLFWACWLAAWWYVMGLMLGGVANLWLHRLVGGAWGRALRPAALAAASRLPWALLLLLPLALGLRQLYPWAADPQGWAQALARPAFPTFWLQPPFVALRLALYGALWWWLTRPASLASKGRAAAALALYALTGTLASVDLLMSLVPGWFSTAFGLVVLAGQALGGTALGAWQLARRAPAALAAEAAEQVPVARDLGNLLLMWLLTWAYLAFMEFLIIWAENLPAEIAWYVPRLHSGWWGVGVALVLLQLALPLLALLQRPLKDRPRRLGFIAAWLLLTQALNTAWLVLPSVATGTWLGWWLLPLLVLGMGLLLFEAPAAAASTAPAPAAKEVGHVRA